MIEKPKFHLAGLGLLLILLGVALGYEWALHRDQNTNSAMRPTQESARMPMARILYWYDPMKPDQHFDKPGKSPFMDMDLVPMMAGSNSLAGEDDAVHIDPALVQNLGVKLAMVEKGRLHPVVRAAGLLTFNDRLVSIIQARTAGFVERVYDRAPGDVLPEGALLADIRVPEWYGAQAEYVALRKSGELNLTEAARLRLYQLGMNGDQVNRLQKTLIPQAVVTISLDRTGVLLELGAREGMTVVPGQTLARLNGLESLWLDVEIPESQGVGLAVGNAVTAQFDGASPSRYQGHISALLPELDKETRTVRVRVEIPNPHGSLRPGMFARTELGLQAGGPERWLIPEEALITMEGKSRVILAVDQGHFMPVQVQTGGHAQGKVEIIDGLKEGDRVVVSGQFLIDSEASLKGVLMRMNKRGAR